MAHGPGARDRDQPLGRGRAGRAGFFVSVLKKAGYEQTRSGRSGAQLSATQIFYRPDYGRWPRTTSRGC
ncbi:LytR C-terminal domain-containing protein [Kocuria rhizophila]|nr:LytR C-terminal domain-containing protein [Kocuria rhizophila]